nr:E3 ubiquitin-protein ligase MBR2-like [Tanacetum cinerariifolium]
MHDSNPGTTTEVTAKTAATMASAATGMLNFFFFIRALRSHWRSTKGPVNNKTCQILEVTQLMTPQVITSNSLQTDPYKQIMLLEGNSFLGGLNLYDQHRDMRLDIDLQVVTTASFEQGANIIFLMTTTKSMFVFHFVNFKFPQIPRSSANHPAAERGIPTCQQQQQNNSMEIFNNEKARSERVEPGGTVGAGAELLGLAQKARSEKVGPGGTVGAGAGTDVKVHDIESEIGYNK